MTDDVRFVQDDAVVYGEPLVLSPLIRRVVAHNPNPFTFTGTGTYIVGRGTVAILILPCANFQRSDTISQIRNVPPESSG